MRDALESNVRTAVGAGGECEPRRILRLFLYERDAPTGTFIEDFVSETRCCHKSGEGFGAIAYSALTMHLGVNVHFRIPHENASGSEWWSAAPGELCPNSSSHTLRASGTGCLPSLRCECGNGFQPGRLQVAPTVCHPACIDPSPCPQGEFDPCKTPLAHFSKAQAQA